MKERPILFSAPMVRAILAGNKTVTRRLVKPAPQMVTDHSTVPWDGEPADLKRLMETNNRPCPYGQPGDRLWVRETWAVQRHEPCMPHERDYQDLISPVIRYRADGATRRIQGDRATGVGVYHGAVEKTRVSIHMPRWASRITLEITGVRVERLLDITTEQIRAEGLRTHLREHDAVMHLRDQWKNLWASINGDDSLAANPWVWVVEFKRIEPTSSCDSPKLAMAR